MKCPICSHGNDDDKRFCTHCGAALAGRRCTNGHTIPDGLTDCPFCPRAIASPPAAGVGREPTVAVDAGHAAPPAGRPKRTMLVSPTELHASGVRAGSVAPPPPTSTATPPSPSLGGSRGRTTFRAPGEPVEVPAAVPPSASQPTTGSSPLVGFLVSFTVHENGVYWPLRYGRTTIGSAADSDVLLAADGVSTKHAEVMVRDNKGVPRIWITDNNSTNGTSLNGEDIFTDRPPLDHGDSLGISGVTLKVILLPAST